MQEDRKLAMACCLILAHKFNDPEGVASLHKLWLPIEETLTVSRKQVLKMEFAVYFHLDFDFHVPLSDVVPHFERTLKVRLCIRFANGWLIGVDSLQALELTREKYIDEDMWQMHLEARGLADDLDAIGYHHNEEGHEVGHNAAGSGDDDSNFHDSDDNK